MEKDDFFIKRIRELANLSYRRDIAIFSDFLNLSEQSIVKAQASSFPGTVTSYFGGYEQAERVIASFCPCDSGYDLEYPIQCLKIEPKALKFSEALTHRDYLGAVLNLGVDRGVIGDILIQEHTAWIFCHSRIADFLLDNLTRVRHTSVRASLTKEPQELPEIQFSPVSGTCSSVRLDALIALAFRESRSSMAPLIGGGQVFVNGKLITSNGYEPKEGDIISVRGKGRFIFEGVSGKTKKGRISVRLLRYQ